MRDERLYRCICRLDTGLRCCNKQLTDCNEGFNYAFCEIFVTISRTDRAQDDLDQTSGSARKYSMYTYRSCKGCRPKGKKSRYKFWVSMVDRHKHFGNPGSTKACLECRVPEWTLTGITGISLHNKGWEASMKHAAGYRNESRQ